jgi:hypothetical protein
MTRLLHVCHVCKGRGWVYDFIRWPKDHFAEPCAACKGYGSFTFLSVSATLQIRWDHLQRVYDGGGSQALCIKVLDRLIQTNLYPGKEVTS